MFKKKIDNRGLPCPQPVLNTKKALDELARQGVEDYVLTAIVDNDAAKENVARFAASTGSNVTTEQKGDAYYITIQKSAGGGSSEAEDKLKEIESCSCSGKISSETTIFLFKSSTLGEGSEELGNILMRSFIFTIKETGSLPAKMLFLNSGVYLTVHGSPVLEELQELEKMGVEIYSCGTCLDYYQLNDKLEVGSITNMYDTMEEIHSATKCITF